VVYHYRPKRFLSFMKMMYRYGWAQGFLVRKYGLFRKIQFLPLVSLLLLIILIGGGCSHLPLTLLVSLSMLCLLTVYFRSDLFITGFSGFLLWHAGFFKGVFMRLSNKGPYARRMMN